METDEATAIDVLSSGFVEQALVPKPKRIKKKCKHGRSTYRCRDCGVGYCKHGRDTYRCRDCLADNIQGLKRKREDKLKIL